MKIFQSKSALVTGASRGIGKAIALELADQGANILLHYRKNEEAAQAVKKEIEQKGCQVWLYQSDLTNENERQSLCEKILSEHQSLDIFIANAAATAFKPLIDLEAHHITKTLDLVITSFILLTKKLHPILKNRESHIVTISGIDTVKIFPGHGLLAAAKSALETLTKYFAVELADDKIHVKGFNPGFVDTDSTRFYLGSSFDELTKKIADLAPQKGVGSVEDVAKIVRWLCQTESDWMTGQTLHADGGLSLKLF